MVEDTFGRLNIHDRAPSTSKGSFRNVIGVPIACRVS